MIELKPQINETLESMASAIFKSWFVDFEPVQAKVEDHKPSGINAEAAALFPDAFENSQLGKVPKDWRSIWLNEIADFIKGVSYKSEYLQESEVALAACRREANAN